MVLLDRPSYRLSRGYLLLSLFYMGLIFYLSSLPGSALGPDTPVWRLLSNLAHIPLFGGLGVCLAMTFRQWTWRSRAVGTLGVGLAYALFDEVHQGFVPGRTMSISDVGLDLIGVAAALCLLWFAVTGAMPGHPLKTRQPQGAAE